jgi:hypothetical protein
LKSRSDPRVERALACVPRGPSPLVDFGPKRETTPRKRLPQNGADGSRAKDSNLATEIWRAYRLLEAAVEEAAAALEIDRSRSGKLLEIQRKALESVHAGALEILRLAEALRRSAWPPTRAMARLRCSVGWWTSAGLSRT